MTAGTPGTPPRPDVRRLQGGFPIGWSGKRGAVGYLVNSGDGWYVWRVLL